MHILVRAIVALFVALLPALAQAQCLGMPGFCSPSVGVGGGGGPTYTVTGPTTGTTGSPSTNFTVTVGTGAFSGTETFTIADSPAGGTFTPSLGSPGTSTVTVIPTVSTTNFTFTYNAVSNGVKTLTFTNGQQWADPAPWNYTASSGVSCSQATAFLARTSGLNGTETTAYTNLICGLVTDGIITGSLSGATACGAPLDALYIFATNTTATANLNICGTNNSLTQTGAVTFTADQGYTGNGTTGYLDSGFVPTALTGNMTLQSVQIGVYIRTSRTTSQNYIALGASNGGTGGYLLFQPLASGNISYDLNDSTFTTFANSNAQGSWLATRTGPSTRVVYKNGSVFTSVGVGSVAQPNQSITIAALHDSGGVSSFSSDQQSAAWFGAGVNATQAGQIQSRINAFMTALGINVY